MRALKWILASAVCGLFSTAFAAQPGGITVSHYESLQRLNMQAADASTRQQPDGTCPFPGYPLRGSYRIKGQVLSLDAGSGESLANMYLQKYRQRDYLLTAEEFETWERTGTVGACALVSGGHPGSE